MAGMSASGPGPVSSLDQVDKGLKETLIDALNAILSPVQEVRAAAEERIKVLEVTEGKTWRWMLPQHVNCRFYTWALFALKCVFVEFVGLVEQLDHLSSQYDSLKTRWDWEGYKASVVLWSSSINRNKSKYTMLWKHYKGAP